MENNIFLKWIGMNEYQRNKVAERIDNFHQNNPEATVEEERDFISHTGWALDRDYLDKKQSLAIECARQLGTSDEEINAMIEDLQNRGWIYFPQIVEQITDFMCNDVKITLGKPDEIIPNPNIKPEDMELSTEVASIIFDQVKDKEMTMAVSPSKTGGRTR